MGNESPVPGILPMAMKGLFGRTMGKVPRGAVLLVIFAVTGLSIGPASSALALQTMLSADPEPCYATTSGQIVLTVTNDGASDIGGFLAEIEVWWGDGNLASGLSGPSPAPPATLAAGATGNYTWAFDVSATAVGTIRFSATASGIDQGTMLPVESSTLYTLYTFDKAALSSLLWPWPLSLTMRAGDPLFVVLSVSNSGFDTALFVMPAIEITSAISATTGASSVPPGSQDIIWGMTRDWFWSCSVTGVGTLALSATATGQGWISGEPVSTSGTLEITVLPRAELSATLWYSVAPTAPGDWVTVTMDVGNIGAGPADVVAPSLELNPCVVSATLMAGPLPPGPVNLLPGQATSFTWTFSVSGVGDISFTGTAQGIDGYTGVTIGSATSFTMDRQPWAALSATLWSVPASPSLANWFNVIMTVSNSGAESATLLIPSLDANVSGGVAEYILGPVPASATLLLPGQRVAFTWTYSVSGVGDLAFTGTITAADAYTAGVVGSATSFVVDASTKGRLITTVTAAPNPALFGGGITVTMRVTNNGLGSVTGITATMLVESGSSILVPYRTPPAMGPVSLAAGANTRFVWTFTAAGIGTVTFAATAYGTDMISGLPVWTTTISGMRVITGATLEAQLFNLAFPAAAYGSWVDEILLVYNYGSSPALMVTPELEVTSMGSTVYLAVAPPPATINLPPGAYHFFTWTYSVTGAGQVDFSTTVTAVDQLSAYSISTSTTGSLFTRYRAILSCTTYASPDPAFIGQTINTRTVVTNKGTETAWMVNPSLRVLNGGLCVSEVLAPSMVLTIPPGQSVTMYWDHSAVKGGVFEYVTSIDALDPVFGTLYAESGESVAILKPGALSGTLVVTPGAVSVGQWVNVTYTVSNVGDAPVWTLNALQAVGPGALLLDNMAAPAWLPFTLAPGASTVFTWTWSVSGRGTGLAVFTVTGTGIDSALGLALSAPCTARLAIATPALLTTSMYVLSATAKQGSEVTVVLTVTNGGEAPAVAVVPEWVGTIPGDGAQMLSGPLPPGPITLGAGQATTFAWTWRVASFPALGFAATITGYDFNTGYPLLATVATSTLWVAPAPFLSLAVAVSPPATRQGEPIDVTVTVSNTGEASADGVFPVLTGLPGSSFTVVEGPIPSLPATMAPHSSVQWRWRLTSMKVGALAFTVSASGIDPADGAAVGGITAGEVRVTSRFDKDLVLYPNPATGDEANIALRLDVDAGEVLVEAYDASMRLVYKGRWVSVSASQPIVTMTGLKKWAPGVYLLRVSIADTPPDSWFGAAQPSDGRRGRVVKVVKLEVRR